LIITDRRTASAAPIRPCRALQKSPLFVRWGHSGIFRASGCMIKFYTAYCASSHHGNILCNFGTNLYFCVIFNCCEARAVNCTRGIEHRNEIAKCFLTVGILGKIVRLCLFIIPVYPMAPNAGGMGQSRRLLTNNRLYIKTVQDRHISLLPIKVE